MTMQPRQRAASWLTKDAKTRRAETCAITERRDEILNNWENKHSYSKEVAVLMRGEKQAARQEENGKGKLNKEDTK
jgi:hypothetical protein